MKNSRRNKIMSFTGIIAAMVIAFVMMDGCKVPESISSKSGAQLWGENCIRCHNSPDPKTYSDDQWDAATEHMRQKAILTDVEITKIRSFLKSAN
jgi:hypothetical protein